MYSILNPSQCMTFRRGTFSVVESSELQKQHLLGKQTPWALSIQRRLHSFKVHCRVAICKHGIILVRRWYSYYRALCDNQHRFVSSGQHLVDGKRLSASASGSSKTVPPQTPQNNYWHGLVSVFLTDWLVASVIRSGRRIHPTKPPRLLYLEIS